MKKNYIAVYFSLIAIVLSISPAAAQLQAVDDVINVLTTSGINGPINVLSNDLLNGNPVSLSQVTVTAAQGDNLFLYSDGTLYYNPSFPGTHLLTYQICLQGSPNTCSTATVQLNCTCPPIVTPNVSNIVSPTCANPTGSITIDNMPSNITLLYSVDGGPTYSIGSINNIGLIPVQNNPGIHIYHIIFKSGDCYSASVDATVSGTGLVSFATTGFYVDFNNNGVTDVGDVVNYQYNLQNNTCTDLHDLHVFSEQTPVAGGPLPILAAGSTDSTTFSSLYVLNQNDISTGSVSQFSFLTGEGGLSYPAFGNVPLSLSDGIRLVAFIDSNGNGIKDTGEPNFTYGQFIYIRNNDGVTHDLTSTLSPIIYETNPANNYNISYSVAGIYAQYYGVTASYSNITIANGSGITTYYFPIVSLPYADLQVLLFTPTPPRPGFSYTNYLYFTNNGNQPIASGTITFTKDDALTISSVTPSATITTPSGFSYTFNDLLPNESRILTILMSVPTIPDVALGQLVTNSASATFPAADVDTNNNNSILTRTVISSYDPNIKSESHAGKVLHSAFGTDEFLTYTIQFENTGTANAVNVNVEDVLDSQLDENSVRMLRSSHPYTLERIGTSLTWTFAGIDLPPSVANTDTGHGYVVFQVKPKPGYAVGDIIPNTADIYFDFNPAIVTNTCTTEFVNTLSTEDFAFDNFNYYPNPVKNILTLSNDRPIEKVLITSTLGQTVMETAQNDLKPEIDLSVLPTGMYLVKVLSGSQQKQIKIVKQ